MAVAPTAAAQSGGPGTLITYTLRVTNTGAATDVYTLTVSGPAWPIPIYAPPGRIIWPTFVRIQLDPGEARTVGVFVTLPRTTTGGALEVGVFSARSQTVPAVSASASLTTTATYSLY